jgi:hypothetical protein
MSDEELDAAIAERFKAYEAGTHLPDEFKGRFVSSMRRKRTVRRLWMLGLIGAMALASVAIVNLTKPAVVSSNVKPALMASTAPTNETVKVSYLMLLGYLRECFARSKSARRKEEE